MIIPLTPAVYKLRADDKKGHYLELFRNTYIVEGKTYGKTNQYVEHFWTSYAGSSGNMGVMLTGEAGSGKSRCCEMLANLAIANGMCVVIVTKVGSITGLVEFIDGLHNMVIVFDEFGKYFDIKTQQRMLAMFSVKTELRKLFVITENSITSVNQYIRCRPGRVRYGIDFSRLEEDVLDDYCADNNVLEYFKSDIIKLWLKSPSFTFDHLTAIVTEHNRYPELAFAEIMDLLNLDDLVITRAYKPHKVTNILKPDTVYVIDSCSTTNKNNLTRFFKYYDGHVRFHEVVSDGKDTPLSLVLKASNFKELDNDNSYIFEVDGFLVTVGETE